MVINTSKIYGKIPLRTLVINRINEKILRYKDEFRVESIFFNIPVDGIAFISLNNPLYYGISNSTLYKILKEIEKKHFYGYHKCNDGQLVKIKPKNGII